MTCKKYSLVIPVSGQGRRFVEQGINIPKPMLACGGRSIIERGLDSIDYSECDVVFIVREDHIQNYAIDAFLKERYPECSVISIRNQTSGAVETVLAAGTIIDCQLPLIIYTPDTTFEPIYKPQPCDFEHGGFLLTFKANSPNYSYSKIDSRNLVTEIAEKQVISDAASVGVYGFQRPSAFFNMAKEYIDECKAGNKESHIAPIYNKFIRARALIKVRSINSIHIMGTPEEFAFCEEVSFKYIRQRKYALCCDHSGFELKNHVKLYLEKNNIPFIDFGCYSKRDCDYNEYVDAACNYVLKEKDFFGIGCCRSGQGVNIYANKKPGIRAALVNNHDSASLAIRHNAANFFSLPESVFLAQNEQFLESVMRVIYTETFDGGRFQGRLMQHV